VNTFTDIGSWDSDGKYVEKYSDFLDRLYTLPKSISDPVVVVSDDLIVQDCIDEIEKLRDTMVEENVYSEGIFSQGAAQSVHKGILRIIGQVHRIKHDCTWLYCIGYGWWSDYYKYRCIREIQIYCIKGYGYIINLERIEKIDHS